MNIPFTPTFQNTWNEWLQYRKERKLPKYTDTGLKRTITHLLNISANDEQTAILIVEQSISQNYQGLFPLKNNYNAKQKTDGRNEVQAELNNRLAKWQQAGN